MAPFLIHLDLQVLKLEHQKFAEPGAAAGTWLIQQVDLRQRALQRFDLFVECHFSSPLHNNEWTANVHVVTRYLSV